MPIRSRASTRRRSLSRHSATPNIPRSREKHSVSHSQERVQNRFGVAVGTKAVAALLQFTAQFQMIVNLAVEDDDSVAILGNNGLIAALNVDNLQPRSAQRDGVRLKDALLIRTAMDNARHRILDSARRGRAMPMRKAGYAAQFSGSPASVGHAHQYATSDADTAAVALDCRARWFRPLRHWTWGRNSEVSMRS